MNAQSHDELVRRAERTCRDRNLKLTPMRRRVLGTLAGSRTPLSASALIAAIGAGAEKAVSPILIYRALDFLNSEGLIHRLAGRNAYVPCDHEHSDGEVTVLLVCRRCGTVDEVASREIERSLDSTAAATGFKPLNRVVELEGECVACQQVAPAAAGAVA